MNYRLYGMGIHGWEYITMENNLESLYDTIYTITYDEYQRLMIIEHNILLNQDNVIMVSEVEQNPPRRRR